MAPGPTRHARRRLLQSSLVLGAVALLSGCAGFRLPGQQPAKIPRIGYLGVDSADNPTAQAFQAGLHELGYIDGQTLTMEWRFADGQEERLPDLMAELLSLPLDLLLTAGPVSTRVARDATRTLPIVMCYPGDPIGLGIVASPDHPGGNITGLASLTTELNAKRLELLAEARPGLSQVALFWESGVLPSARGPLQSAARALNLQTFTRDIQQPQEMPAALEAAVAAGVQAVLLTDATLFTQQRSQIAALALGHRLPLSASNRAFVEVGALMSYSARVPDMYRRAASTVDKILKGARPADIPVERPPTFDFVINSTTAQTLSLMIPPSVLQQATEIIQ
jgi:putative tryptophan/tyrosine transport system substrate-binding protein